MTKKDVPAGGKIYSYYVCSNNINKRGCSAPHRIPKEKLEDTVFALLQEHIQAVLDMERVLKYIDEVPFKDIEVRQLNERKDRLEQDVAKWKEHRNSLYEDLKDGVISKEDYEELHARFSAKRSAAEEEIRSINHRIKDVVSENTDKYRWMSYFTEHKDIKELTRAVAVKLIQQVKVTDKNNIEVIFSFDDSFCAYAGMVTDYASNEGKLLAMPERITQAADERKVI